MDNFKLERRGVSGRLHAFNDNQVKSEEHAKNSYMHIEISYHIPNRYWIFEINQKKLNGHCTTMYRGDARTLEEAIKEVRELGYQFTQNPLGRFTLEVTKEQIEYSKKYYKNS